MHTPGPILVVDDDREIRSLIATVLEEEGYSVETASTAGEALEYFLLRPPALIILDWHMPLIDGYLLYQMINRRPERKPAILFISADPQAAALARTMDVLHFLSKPFDVETLVALVVQGLATGSEAQVNPYTDGL